MVYNLTKLCKIFGYIECKRKKWDWEEGGDGGCFQRRKVQVSCLDLAKLKGNGEVPWCGVNGIIVGVQ